MENKDNNMSDGHPMGCRCMGCHGHRHLWHWIIKLVILVIVFWLGVKVGELKMFLNEEFYGSYGPGMMYGRGMMWGNNYQNYPTGPGMMYNWFYGSQSTTTKR